MGRYCTQADRPKPTLDQLLDTLLYGILEDSFYKIQTKNIFTNIKITKQFMPSYTTAIDTGNFSASSVNKDAHSTARLGTQDSSGLQHKFLSCKALILSVLKN